MQKLTLKLRDHELNFRRALLLLVPYSIPPAVAMLPITDPDIWWRLRTGQWIVERNSVPVTDVFSAFSMGKPWIEYSWLFEVLVYHNSRAIWPFGISLLGAHTIIPNYLCGASTRSPYFCAVCRRDSTGCSRWDGNEISYDASTLVIYDTFLCN